MNFDYDAAREIARQTIEKYGGAGQAIKPGATGGFDSSGNVTPDIADVIIDGIITPLVLYTIKEINGTSIKEGDSWVYFQSDTKPDVNMQITLNGVTLRIVAIPTVTSISGVNIYQKLQLRA
jgi:hypothetical protein